MRNILIFITGFLLAIFSFGKIAIGMAAMFLSKISEFPANFENGFYLLVDGIWGFWLVSIIQFDPEKNENENNQK